MRNVLCLLFFMVSFFSAHADDEGTYEGQHWQISGESHKNQRCLIVDGKTILNKKHSILPREIGGKLYFEAENDIGTNQRNLFSINGDKLISSYDMLDFPENDEGWNWVQVIRTDNPNSIYTSDLRLLHSNVSILKPKVISLDGVNGKFLDVMLENDKEDIIHALYTIDWKLLIPIYKTLYWLESKNCFVFISHNGFEGRLNKSFQWIGPSPSIAQQFERVVKLSNNNIPTKYYKCQKGGYWGLYDSNFMEILAPDYEDLSYFEGTNFFKFKLNGFWGIISIQNKSVKELIPTTRGYTSIDRYIKSLNRFTYTMFGFKGECDASTGRQLSKIKVDTPQQTSTASSSSNSSSSSSNTGNGTSTIVVEHHRDPVPMQEWQACIGCGGIGTMGCHSCGGSGSKYIGDKLRRCGLCNGRGIIPCNVCYGNKGQYITVYR